MRAFLAVPVPEELRAQLLRVQEGLRAGLQGVHWVAVESLHVTMVFLGELDERVAGLLADDGERACAGVPAGIARVGGLGCFPPRGPARVLWCGVDAEGGLRALHRILAGLARDHGIAVESRPFAPHLTLGRARRPLPRVAVERLLEAVTADDLGTIPVDRCTLYRSTLGPGGARHEALRTMRLGAAAREGS